MVAAIRVQKLLILGGAVVGILAWIGPYPAIALALLMPCLLYTSRIAVSADHKCAGDLLNSNDRGVARSGSACNRVGGCDH